MVKCLALFSHNDPIGALLNSLDWSCYWRETGRERERQGLIICGWWWCCWWRCWPEPVMRENAVGVSIPAGHAMWACRLSYVTRLVRPACPALGLQWRLQGDHIPTPTLPSLPHCHHSITGTGTTLYGGYSNTPLFIRRLPSIEMWRKIVNLFME